MYGHQKKINVISSQTIFSTTRVSQGTNKQVLQTSKASTSKVLSNAEMNFQKSIDKNGKSSTSLGFSFAVPAVPAQKSRPANQTIAQLVKNKYPLPVTQNPRETTDKNNDLIKTVVINGKSISLKVIKIVSKSEKENLVKSGSSTSEDGSVSRESDKQNDRSELENLKKKLNILMKKNGSESTFPFPHKTPEDALECCDERFKKK